MCCLPLGKEAIELNPGHCINIPRDIKHWRGASKDSWFSHLAIEVSKDNSSTEWLDKVNNEEYNKIK